LSGRVRQSASQLERRDGSQEGTKPVRHCDQTTYSAEPDPSGQSGTRGPELAFPTTLGEQLQAPRARQAADPVQLPELVHALAGPPALNPPLFGASPAAR
jgi:hypothetical protein